MSYDRHSQTAEEDRYFSWAKAPGINPLKVVTVIAGFAIFPPLGVAALAYFIWNERRYGRGRWRHGFAHEGGGRHCGRGGMGRTGNSAFDEHRRKAMDDLEEERKAFAEHREAIRRERDREAFEAFAAKRAEAKPDDKPADGQA